MLKELLRMKIIFTAWSKSLLKVDSATHLELEPLISTESASVITLQQDSLGKKKGFQQ